MLWVLFGTIRSSSGTRSWYRLPIENANVRRYCIWAPEFHPNASHILIGAAGSMSAPQIPSAPYTWPAKPPDKKLPYIEDRTYRSSVSVHRAHRTYILHPGRVHRRSRNNMAHRSIPAVDAGHG